MLQIFKLVDIDGNNQISANEVQHLMKLLGETVDINEVDNLIQNFDLDGSGEVDLTEFIFVVALQRKSDYKRADVMRYEHLYC
jgi:Ca2+-binding EF-hand superfamily protein